MNEARFDFAGNAITRLCGVKYPIFLGGMAAISRPRHWSLRWPMPGAWG